MFIAGFPAGPGAPTATSWRRVPGRSAWSSIPARTPQPVSTEVVREHRLKPVSVLVTHGHVDHMWCVAPVAGTYDATAWIHPSDRHLLSDPMAGMSPGDHPDAARWRLRVGRARRRARALRPRGARARRAAVRRRPHAGPHPGLGDLPHAVRAAGRLRADVLRRPALRRVHRPHRPARRRPRHDAAQPGRQGAAARRRHRGAARPRRADVASAASAPPTPSSKTSRRRVRAQ